MKNKSDAIIALSVIACSVVLLGALFFAVAGNPFEEPHLRFSVDFEDLTGIQRTSAVLYAGDEIGYVEDIEHLKAGDRLTDDGIIRAHLAIKKAVPLPANVEVGIGSTSLLGEKHIALQRRDDEGGLLADGARLSATHESTFLETLVPGANEIIVNIQSITEELRSFTDGLGESDMRENLEGTLSEARRFTGDLNTLVSGEVEAIELHRMLVQLVTDLNEVSRGMNDLVSGPEGAPDEGLSARSAVILTNLEDFSRDLNETMSGVPGGAPGLRAQLEEITREIHLIVVGGRPSREGLQPKIDRVTRDIEALMAEVQTLIVWSEYIAGTLAERPSRLIWGSEDNDVPTKQEILEHFRRTGQPYPVRIPELENDHDGENDRPFELRRNGMVIPRSDRE